MGRVEDKEGRRISMETNICMRKSSILADWTAGMYVHYA